jgi:hypothetical protein
MALSGGPGHPAHDDDFHRRDHLTLADSLKVGLHRLWPGLTSFVGHRNAPYPGSLVTWSARSSVERQDAIDSRAHDSGGSSIGSSEATSSGLGTPSWTRAATYSRCIAARSLSSGGTSA